MEVRYVHSLAPRACDKVYTIMRGPLTVDGGFDTDKTAFHEPTGARCTCADGGKRTPVDLHMLNPNEMAELGTAEKRGVEFIEVAIGMTKSDDDEADGTPQIAEDLPLVEAKKPKRKPKVKPEPEPPFDTPFVSWGKSDDAPKAEEKPKFKITVQDSLSGDSWGPERPVESTWPFADKQKPADEAKPEPEKAPERNSTWPFGEKVKD